jgi:zinc/manganese transport system substrate-binding protein
MNRTATTALQDPHRIEARPSLIAKARVADLVFCTGADLEAAWLPLVLKRAGKGGLQKGDAALLYAADAVQLLDVPTSLDRAQGDVHPYGNPHIQTDPRRIAQVAAALAERLRMLDAANAAHYTQRHGDFSRRWQEAMTRWEAQAQPLKDLPVVVQHASWTYLGDWLGLRTIAAIEPRPGLPPSGTDLARLLERLRATPARLILRAAYQEARPAEWLATQSGLPVAVLPFTVGGADDARDLFALFDATLARLIEATR